MEQGMGGSGHKGTEHTISSFQGNLQATTWDRLQAETFAATAPGAAQPGPRQNLYAPFDQHSASIAALVPGEQIINSQARTPPHMKWHSHGSACEMSCKWCSPHAWHYSVRDASDVWTDTARHGMAGYPGALLAPRQRLTGLHAAMPQPQLHPQPQLRQQLYRLVPVEQDSVTGLATNVDPGELLYQLTQAPIAGGLPSLTGLVVQTPQASFLPVLSGGTTQLQPPIGGAVQRGQTDEQHPGLVSLVVGQMPGVAGLPTGAASPFALQGNQQACFAAPGPGVSATIFNQHLISGKLCSAPCF